MPKAKFSAPKFRTQSISLSSDDVKEMIKNYDFYCREYDWSKNYCNPQGKGFKHQFEIRTLNNEKLVFDHASNLMWQQSGSQHINYEAAKEFINDLNKKGFAGYQNWRLPTLEETMSLMKPERKKNDLLYIDPIFNATQFTVWTADLTQIGLRAAWVVLFSEGSCYWFDFYSTSSVRAVRSGQSDQPD